MSEGINSTTFHMHSLDQDQFSIDSPVTDDEQSSLQISTSNGRPVTRTSIPAKRSSSPFRKFQIGRSSSRRSGTVLIKSKRNVAKQFLKEPQDDSDDEDTSESEKDSQSQEIFERQAENERLSVQDMIHYFESRTETSNSTSKDLETDIRRRSAIISPEKVANRRWSGVSSGSSPISANERISVSAEGCSSTYECTPDYAPQSIRRAQGMDISGDNFELERHKQQFDEHSLDVCDDAIFPSQGSWNRIQSSTVTSSAFYDFEDDALRNRKSMPTDNVTPGYESELRMEQYLLAYDNKLRLKSEMMRLPPSDIRNNADSFRNLVKSETEILDEINRVANHKKFAGDDTFVIPERRGVSDPVLQAHVYVTKDVDRIMSQWYNLRNEDRSASSDSFIVPARSLSNERTDTGWKMNLNNKALDSTICNPGNAPCYSKGKEENSGGRMSAQKKFGLVGLEKAAKTSDLRGLQKDLEKIKSQLPVRGVKSSNKGGETTSSLVSKSSNHLKTKKEKEENRKRVEDARLRRSDGTSAVQRDSLIPTKPTHTLLRASSFQLPSAKPKINTKPSPSSSLNTGKVVTYRGNISSDSPRSSAMDSNHTRNSSIRKPAPTVVNPATAVEKPRTGPVACSFEVRKENNKPLLGRNKPSAMKQQNAPTQLIRKAQQKTAKPGSGACLVEANGSMPRPNGKLSSAVSTDILRHGLTKGKL
ncbi:hypothetical protein O6H91_22G060200 [Diphasiastrum complanatum]|uniref:Uncharacterized protein n=1 Tax=Diphasiastrum complanatum TaxID=34168 RepID=A0ACC2AHD4_DIPCM|nr:hypothetical protein O6H91_22G060200 [Diphasiastrum complanatum]